MTKVWLCLGIKDYMVWVKITTLVRSGKLCHLGYNNDHLVKVRNRVI